MDIDSFLSQFKKILEDKANAKQESTDSIYKKLLGIVKAESINVRNFKKLVSFHRDIQTEIKKLKLKQTEYTIGSALYDDLEKQILKLEHEDSIMDKLINKSRTLSKIRKLSAKLEAFSPEQQQAFDKFTSSKNPLLGAVTGSFKFQSILTSILGKFPLLSKAVGFFSGVWGQAIIYIGKQIWKLLQMLSDLQRKMMDATGYPIERADHLLKLAHNYQKELAKYGATLEDVIASTGAVAEEFNNMLFTYNERIVKSVSLISKGMGVTNEEGARALKTFMFMANASENTATANVGIVKSLSLMNGVAPRRVIRDIEKSSEQIYTHFRGNTKELMAAAVYANKLGTSISNIASSMEKMLDFDTSIEAELNASVMLGRNVNFAQARMYAFRGEMTKFTDEILKQVGSIDKFNKLNYFAKKALADATGMEISALETMLNQQVRLNALNKVGIKDKDLQNMSVSQLKSKINSISDEEAKRLLTEQMQVTAMEEFNALINQLKMNLLPIARLFNGILEIINNILGALSFSLASSEGLTKSIEESGVAQSGMNSQIGTSILMWGLVVGVIGKYIAAKYLAIKAMLGFGHAATATGTATTGMLAKIGAGIGSLGTGIATFLTSMTTAITGFITSMATSLATGISSLGAAAMTPQFWAGMGALAVLTGMIIGIGYAMNLATENADKMGVMFTSIFDGIAKVGSAGMLGLAAGIYALSGGLLLLSKTALFAAPALATLFAISQMGDGLLKAAQGISGINTALQSFKIPNIENIEVLEKISGAVENINITATSDSSLLDEIKELKKAILAMEVKMDGKVVGQVIAKATTTV